MAVVKQQQQNALTFISYSMHGFNQGFSTIRDVSANISPDVWMLQEHWATPNNLCKFDMFTEYFSFGNSALQ